MQATTSFLLIDKMLERVKKAKEESDTSYFFDLLLLGELITKIITASLISGIENDKDRNRYRNLHRIVRADGIGEWTSTLDESLVGVSSQYLQDTIAANEHKELQTKMKAGTWQHDCVASLTSIFPFLGLDVIALPEKVQARQWFLYFSQLRNGTRGHGAIQPHECSQACTGLERSIKLIIENFYLFKRQWVYLHQNLNGKYRVTNLNNSTENFDSLKGNIKHEENYANGVYIYFDKKTIVELLVSDPDATDFYLPNGNFKDKSFELLSYISNQRQFNDSSKYLTPANELPQSETQGLGELEVQENCFGNIPPLPNDYIHRKSLEDDLVKILSQLDRYPIVTLRGRGGIGKTTLALSVIHEIAKTERFEIILWFSSRDIDLQLDGPKPVKNAMLTELDLADEFVKLLDVKDLSKKQERIQYLANQMTSSSYGKILFVFDNFETVQNPSDLFNWIDTYVRNPNKVLITSRISKSFKADFPIEIHGMDDTEAKELINQTAQNLNIQSLLTDALQEDIIEEAQGHPYVMKILLGQIAINPKDLHIERIMATQDDILTALFKRTYNTLTPAAKRIFLTLCSWRSVIPLIALEAVMLRPDLKDKINVEDSVDELQKSSFIDIIESKTDSFVFISVPLAAFLFGKGELEVSPMKIAILSDRELLQEFGVTQQLDIQNGISPRIERKFKAVAKRISTSNETLIMHIPLLEFLCRKYPYAWNFLYQLYIENNEFIHAEEALREYLKTPLNSEERKYSLQRISSLYRHSYNWFGEVNALTELCLLPNATIEEISDTANVINNYVFRDDSHVPRLILDDEIKESLINKVAEVMDKKITSSHYLTPITATDYSRLAWLYMHLQDQDKAKEAVEKGLAKDFNNPHCVKLARKLGLEI